MFELYRNTFYGDGNNLGVALIVMNGNHAVEFIYMIDEHGNWSFHYEDGTRLTEEERIELENWFITHS